MAKYGYEDDAFDPKVVENERRKRERLLNETGPGGYNFRCHRCGVALGASAMAGVACYHCGCNAQRG